MQAREKLKVLQHSNAQMAAVHKITKVELESKLSEALEQLSSLRANQGEDNQSAAMRRLTSQTKALKTQNANESTCESARTDERVDNTAISKNGLRRRSNIAYKEPPLNVKLRREDSINHAIRHSKPLSNKQNKTLHKVCESQELRIQHRPKSSSAVTSTIISDAVDIPLETSPSSTFLSTSTLLPEPDSGSSELTGVESEFAESRRETVVNTADESIHCSRRMSTGRPARKVTESINTYKEPPLNTKMRRPG
eukprot:c16412_g1_i1 orf=239-997(-)